MPKTIDYPRTTYLSAWEVAEVVDDTGGKCSIEACARKLNRKVSGSFKAILGSAVKFGLLTSKREMLTTTNLFRRIKHAYDKQEEKIHHREAFLHPPLFSHICRKFRNRELPVHMFDVMLVREFGVEEINAQNVARAFVEGARMVDVLDERNVIADIDQLAQATPRRDVASPEMSFNIFRNDAPQPKPQETQSLEKKVTPGGPTVQPVANPPYADDAVSSLFGLSANTGAIANTSTKTPNQTPGPHLLRTSEQSTAIGQEKGDANSVTTTAKVSSISDDGKLVPKASPAVKNNQAVYTIHISGPGLDSQLSVQDETDLVIVQALLEKIKKHLQNPST